MGLLAPGCADAPRGRVVEAEVGPQEVKLAVDFPVQVLIGGGGDDGPMHDAMPAQTPQSRPHEQLEADHRRHRIAGESEYRLSLIHI